MLFEHRLGALHGRKTNLWLVSPQIGVFWRRFFNFQFTGASILKCDVSRLLCQAPSCLIQFKITRGGLALQPWNVTFQDCCALKFKIQNRLQKSPDLWTYKSKDSFFCHATHLIYVQRAFLAQLVETAGVPLSVCMVKLFKTFHSSCLI